MNVSEILKTISSMISEYFSRGLIPDNGTLEFIKTAYGLTETDDIAELIESGDDGGAVITLLSYPPDCFRESIEELIPPVGLSAEEIKVIENNVIKISCGIFIQYHNRKIFMTENDSFLSGKQFVQHLNLDLSLSFINDISTVHDSTGRFSLRTLLRKKRFITNEHNSLFMCNLINNYRPAENSSSDDFLNLLSIASSLISGSERNPFDILTEKKFYFENSVNENEEFTQLMKTYSMEFIMMKKIQPPLISNDEAHGMINTIDRLTLIVYGMIIPSVRNVYLDNEFY